MLTHTLPSPRPHGIRSNVFLRMRQTLTDREQDLSSVRKRLAEVEAERKVMARELAGLKLDCRKTLIFCLLPSAVLTSV